MGDAELANPDQIPVFDFLSNTEMYTCCQGYSHIKGNYQLISDNLLDLSHIHYLHPGIHQGSNFADFTNKVEREGDTVRSMLWRQHYHVDAASRPLFGLEGADEDVEGQGHARWDAPGVLLVDTAFWDHGKGYGEGWNTPNAHLITPGNRNDEPLFLGIGPQLRARQRGVYHRHRSHHEKCVRDAGRPDGRSAAARHG